MSKMKNIKGVVLLVSIILCLPSTINFLTSTNAEASPFINKVTRYGGPELDFEFIYKVVENLSNVVKTYPKGRDAGTPGNHYAGNLVKGWMEEIGLQNVHTEDIRSDWGWGDTWENPHNLLYDSNYHLDGWVENLSLTKNYIQWYLHVKVYDTRNRLVAEKNFSQDECFPFMKEESITGSHNVTLHDVTVADEFKTGGSDQVVLLEADWRDPYAWWISNMTNLKRPNVKGFILMDCHDDTFFMEPSGTSSPIIRPRFSEPGFSINGSSGKWIKQYLNSKDYTVKVDFCSEWAWQQVESWNVIGEIPGRSPQIAIINGFYDGWWNQATCDEAVGVGLILGIAKYIIDNHITPELTLRFISWGSHEWYFNGAKDYLKTHAIKTYGSQMRDSDELEDIIYVFNPGNFGFNNTYNMSFNVGSELDDPLMKYMQRIAQELHYTERTGIGITGEYSVYGTESYVFYHGHHYPERYCEHAIEYDRFPYPGYHRDGKNHTQGDVFSEINDTLFRVDCEVIAETILRLTVPNLHVTIVSPEENSFYLRNLRLFSLPRNTVIYGPMEITADIDSDADIERVEFYFNGKLMKTATSEPYSYRWSPLKSFMYTIKVVAYDSNGNYADDEIQVFKWRIHPLLILCGGLLIFNLFN